MFLQSRTKLIDSYATEHDHLRRQQREVREMNTIANNVIEEMRQQRERFKVSTAIATFSLVSFSHSLRLFAMLMPVDTEEDVGRSQLARLIKLADAVNQPTRAHGWNVCLRRDVFVGSCSHDPLLLRHSE